MAKLEKQFASIPKPTADPLALLKALEAVIANVEVLTGQRGKGIKGVADQLTDLRSQAEGREARFTDYVEVSTANGEALAQRTTTLEAEVDGAFAEIQRVDKAWADGDTAIALTVTNLRSEVEGNYATIQSLSQTRSDLEGSIAQVTTDVTAVANNALGVAGDALGLGNSITANGNVRLVAKAGPSGYSAEYAWELTAGNVYTGMSFLAAIDPDGSRRSEVVLTAEAFRFMDPTLGPVPVFTYADQFYTFNVPVRFTDDVFADKGIRGGKIQDRGITSIWAEKSTDDATAQVTVSIREGAAVRIDCTFRGDPAQPFPFGQVQYLQLFRVGTGGEAATKIDEIPLGSFFAGNSDNRATYFTATYMLTIDAPPGGVWTYAVTATTGQPPVTIVVTEFFK